MKKIFFLLTSLMLLSSCVEAIALLGPTSSVIGGGNIVHSSISSAASYGVKKTTGKSPMQHALAYAEEKNPNKEKKRCISFIEKTNSEACAIVKKQATLTKAKVKKKTKSFFKKNTLNKKNVVTKKVTETAVSPRGQAFAKAKKEGKDSFVFKGKIYSTKFKEVDAGKIVNPFSKKYVSTNKKNNEDKIKNKKSTMELALDLQTALNKRK
jgi:hypothetical protein